MDHVDIISSIITSDPDIILESTKDKLIKWAKKPRQQWAIDNIHNAYKSTGETADYILNFFADASTTDRNKEAGISKWMFRQLLNNPKLIEEIDNDIINVGIADWVLWHKRNPETENINIADMNLESAAEASKMWHESLKAKNIDVGETGEKVIADLGNGYKIVQMITQKQCEIEGDRMGHCVGGYDLKSNMIFSLRDKNNKPHVTIQVIPDKFGGQVEQIKGKENKPPKHKYSKYVLNWLESKFEFPHDYTNMGIKDYIPLINDINKIVRYSNSKNSDIRRAIASNINTPEEILIKLSNDRDHHVVNNIASNPNAPTELLKKFAFSNDIGLIESVAGNPRTPKEILRELSKHKDKYVKMDVAENANSDIETLFGLARENDPEIARSVAWNINSNEEILEFIYNKFSNDGSVIRAIAKNDNITDDLAKKIYVSSISIDYNLSIEYLASNRSIDPAFIDFIAKKHNNDFSISVAAAENPSTTIETLEYILKYGKYERARKKAAENLRRQGINAE